MVNIKFTDGLGGYTGNAGRTKLIKYTNFIFELTN